MKHITEKSKILQFPHRFLKKLISACGSAYSRFERCSEQKPILTPAVMALAINLILEMFGRRSVTGGLAHLLLHPYIFLINALIIFVTLMPAFPLSRRTFVYSCVSVVWLILGITNFVLLGMRTTPLAAIDFGLIVSCFGIIEVYLNLFQIVLIAAGIVLVLFGLYRLFRRTRKLTFTPITRIRRIGAALISCTGFALILAFSLHIGAFTTDFPDLSKAYEDYGFAYCFSLSVLDRGVDRPVDYSEESIDEILENIETEAAAEPAGPTPDTAAPNRQPNIITVQLESFFDVTRLKDLSFSEDPTPIFRALKDEFPSGYLTVPSIGAGTANTEFEILTGMNLDDFGAGEYPYKTVLRQSTCESAAYNLRTLGYSAHALHNNTGTFYERHRVYSMLGFETFTPLEHMTDVVCNPLGWAKDAVLTHEIRACLDSTAGTDFVFAVSVQPHGKYPDDNIVTEQNAYDLPALIDRLFDASDDDTDVMPGNISGNVTATLTDDELADQRITVAGIDDPALAAQYRYYVNQLYETDAFIGALVADLSASDEPTVLVLYGDHLPCFDYTEEDFADGSTPYQTEYVIWSNFPLVASDRDLHAYQLSAHVLSLLGCDEGLITRLHQRYFAAEDPDDTASYLSDLEMLEYDMLYGERSAWDGINPYLPTDLQFGIHPIRIHGVRAVGGSLYITGEHFTAFSHVQINGFSVETVFIDENTLLLPDTAADESDCFTVVQAGADGIVLGESNSYIFTES